MRIALVTTKLQGVGGVEVFNNSLIRVLNKGGHEVNVISKSLIKENEKGDLRILLGEKFNELNRIKEYDSVICNGEFGYAVQHPRAINVFHGGYYGYAKSVEHLVPKEVTETRLKHAKMQDVAAQGKYVVAVSKFAKNILEEDVIKVDEVIPLSVEGTNFRVFHGIMSGTHALAMGRGRYYEKGFDLIESLARTGERIRVYSDIEVKGENVECFPFIEHSEVPMEYNLASCFLHPSRFEAGGYATIESLACGCPLLTNPVGYGVDIKRDIPEFVTDRINDVQEYSEKLRVILGDRSRLSKTAVEYCRDNYSHEVFSKRWLSLIERITT